MFNLCFWYASRLLTFEDAYYQEQAGAMVDMLPQVHMMGEGYASFILVLLFWNKICLSFSISFHIHHIFGGNIICSKLVSKFKQWKECNHCNLIVILYFSVIGQAAFTGKHRWMFADVLGEDWYSISSFESQDIFQVFFPLLHPQLLNSLLVQEESCFHPLM